MSHIVTSVDAYSHQGFKAVGEVNHYNEDRLTVGTRIFAVVDGATALINKDMGGVNPSAFTSKFLSAFLFGADNGDDRHIGDIMADGNAAFRDELRTNWADVLSAGNMGPSAAAAAVKIHDNGTLTVSNLADCSVVILKDGKWQLVSRSCARLKELDKAVFARVVAEVAKGKTYAEVRQDPVIDGMLKRNRALANVEYGVFNCMPETVNFLRNKTIDLDGVEAIAIFSDGMDWPDADSDEDARLQAAKGMFDHGVAGYYRQMKAAYDADASFTQFPRLKHMDDATGILVRLRRK